MGRRLSLNNRRSQTYDDPVNGSPSVRQARRRSRHISEYDHQQLHRPALPSRRSHSSTRSSPARVHAQSLTSTPSPSARYRDLRQSTSSSAQHPLNYNPVTASPLSYQRGHPLAPIPGSPYATDSSPPATPSGRKSSPSTSLKAKGNASGNKGDGEAEVGEGSPRKRKSTLATSTTEFGGGGSASSSPGGKNSANRKSVAMVPYRPPQPQSLTAALEIIALQTSPSGSPEDKEKNTRKGKEKGWERGKEKGEKEGEGRARSSTNTSQNSSHSQPSQSQHSQHSQHSQASSSSSWRLKQKLRPRIITSTFEMQNPAVASAQTSTPTPPDSPTSPLRGRGKARWKVGGGANGSVPPSPTTRRTMLGGGGNKSAMEGRGQGILLRGKEISSPMLAKGGECCPCVVFYFSGLLGAALRRS